MTLIKPTKRILCLFMNTVLILATFSSSVAKSETIQEYRNRENPSFGNKFMQPQARETRGMNREVGFDTKAFKYAAADIPGTGDQTPYESNLTAYISCGAQDSFADFPARYKMFTWKVEGGAQLLTGMSQTDEAGFLHLKVKSIGPVVGRTILLTFNGVTATAVLGEGLGTIQLEEKACR